MSVADVRGIMMPMANKKKDSKLGWHFLPADMKLKYGDGRKAEVGKALSIPKDTKPWVCNEGMHASEKIHNAAQFKVGSGPHPRAGVW